jgi:hypothetical protein
MHTDPRRLVAVFAPLLVGVLLVAAPPARAQSAPVVSSPPPTSPPKAPECSSARRSPALRVVVPSA